MVIEKIIVPAVSLQRLVYDAKYWMGAVFQGRPVLFYAAFALVALCLLVTLWWLLRNFHVLKHEAMLWMRKLYGGHHRRKALQFLGEEGIPIEVDAVQVGRKKPLCTARVHSVRRDTVNLEIVGEKLIGPKDSGAKIVCHFRPLRHAHIRFNCFTTYILAMKNLEGASVLKVKMPVVTRKVKRRRHTRYKVHNQEAVMLRCWEASCVSGVDGKLRFGRPQFEINVSNDLEANRGAGGVLNVSEGGLCLVVSRSLFGEDVPYGWKGYLELRMFIPQRKEFISWFFGAQAAYTNFQSPNHRAMGFTFNTIGVSKGTRANLSLGQLADSSLKRDFRRDMENCAGL